MYFIKNFLKFGTVNLLLLSFISFVFLGLEDISAKEIGLDSMEITLVPETPGANEKVKVSVNSYSFDLNSSEVSFFIDGEIIKKDIGIKTFYFTTGDFGEKTNLKIIVKKVSGGIIEENYSIKPAEVDLIYQLKDPYVPFGYKGKSTLLSNSELTVFAFPVLINEKGETIPKKSLIYKWYKNFDIDLENSGFGKSSYKIDRLDAFPRETRISVRVTSLDGKVVAKKSTVLRPQKTKVEFYLLKPGLPFSFKNVANPDIFSTNIDAEIRAIPYFMEDTKTEKVKYNWQINGRYFTHNKDSDKNKIILANDVNNFAKDIKISLEMVSKNRVLQSLLNTEITVNFLEQTNEERQTFSEGRFKKETSFFDSL